MANTPMHLQPTSLPLTLGLLGGTGLMFGSALVVSRFALGQWASDDFAGLQMVLAGVVSAVLVLTQRRRLPRARAYWQAMAVWGLIGTALPIFFLLGALQYMSSGMVALMTALNPAMMVVLAHFTLPDEPLTPRRLLGVLIAFSGAVVLIVSGENGLSATTGLDWRGPVFVAIGILLASIGLVYIRRVGGGYSALELAFGRLLMGGPMALLILIVTGGVAFSGVMWSGFGALFYAAALGTVAPFVLVAIMLQRLGAVVSSQVGYINPLVATLLGALFLRERLSPWMLLSGVIIFVGIYVLNSSGAKPPVDGAASSPV